MTTTPAVNNHLYVGPTSGGVREVFDHDTARIDAGMVLAVDADPRRDTGTMPAGYQEIARTLFLLNQAGQDGGTLDLVLVLDDIPGIRGYWQAKGFGGHFDHAIRSILSAGPAVGVRVIGWTPSIASVVLARKVLGGFDVVHLVGKSGPLTPAVLGVGSDQAHLVPTKKGERAVWDVKTCNLAVYRPA